MQHHNKPFNLSTDTLHVSCSLNYPVKVDNSLGQKFDYILEIVRHIQGGALTDVDI